MRRVKNLIIGAGISGLCFANFTKEDYLILEKEENAGGLCRTIKRDGYIWDYAGHFFHFNSEQLKHFFEEKMKQEEMVHCKKNTKIFYKGTFIDYPFQKNIHQLEKNEFIDCLYDLYLKEEKDSYSDFESMLYGKFGKSITEKFLKPYNEKLYACELNALDENAMGRFFPYANFDEIIQNMKEKKDSSYNSEFIYPKNGAEVFITALLKKIRKENLILNTAVQKINLKNKTVEIPNETIHYENLISTIPLSDFLFLFEDIIWDTEKLVSNKVLVFNLGFDRKSEKTDIHWIYVPDKEINFYRVGFYDNILNDNKMSLYVEIGFPTERAIDINSELKKTLEHLKKIGIVKNEKLVSYVPLIIHPAYVHISEQAKTYVKQTEKILEDNQIYLLGRYGKWTYCSMEDSMNSAIHLAKRLNEFSKRKDLTIR